MGTKSEVAGARQHLYALAIAATLLLSVGLVSRLALPGVRAPLAAARRHLAAMSDPEGFDPVADTVGAGIYSGKVKRDASGQVIIGEQYKRHNPHPGPVYAGGGFTDIAEAIHRGPDAVKALLERGADPNEIMTGGARPLHTCGMSRRGQMSTELLIKAGAEIEALDAYGYTPLHRMASNNLPVGAEALLRAGADANRRSGPPYAGETPLSIARSSGARDVVEVLKRYGGR
ncbi:ankyrin repeat-containing domain protein [Hyaloraphidium curvatum]|nr:ankyrin repeat-containing domain protein [Hyaloraphidium curvatum]